MRFAFLFLLSFLSPSQAVDCPSGYSVKGECVPVGVSPLAFYLALDDPHHSYSGPTQTFKVEGVAATAHVLNVTSQQWLTDLAFNASSPAKSIWTHQLVVVIPDTLAAGNTAIDTAWLWVTGGGNDNPGPVSADNGDVVFCAQNAVAANTPGAVLKQVPNQPISFASDIPHDPTMYPDGRRTEDGIIAYTWNHFVLKEETASTRDAEWLLRLPMTKSVQSAMDVLEDFLPKLLPDVDVSDLKFVVGGESKRGWTTWTTGVGLLPRLRGIVPVVMDLLNVVPAMPKLFQALGGLTFEFNDYVQAKVVGEKVATLPSFAAMCDVIDAFAYFRPDGPWGTVPQEFIDLPKLVVNAGNDEFFLPADNHDWWDTLPGAENHLLHVPNADHGFRFFPPNNASEIFHASARAFYTALAQRARGARALLEKKQKLRTKLPADIPTFQWSISADGTEIVAHSFSSPPLAVTQWTATTTDGFRDFRLLACRTSQWKNCTQPEADPQTPPLDGGPEPHVVPYTPRPATPTTPPDMPGYRGGVGLPSAGNFTAFVLVAEWASGFTFSTQMSVVPVPRPFPPCKGDDCYRLV